MDTFPDLIEKWDSISEFAEDAGINVAHARIMRLRENIPPEYWDSLVAGAARRRLNGITLSSFSRLASLRRTKCSNAVIPATRSQRKVSIS